MKLLLSDAKFLPRRLRPDRRQRQPVATKVTHMASEPVATECLLWHGFAGCDLQKAHGTHPIPWVAGKGNRRDKRRLHTSRELDS
jgi:hypothetical protein